MGTFGGPSQRNRRYPQTWPGFPQTRAQVGPQDWANWREPVLSEAAVGGSADQRDAREQLSEGALTPMHRAV